MNIAVIGLSHKTAPVEVREKLSIPTPKIEGAIARLTSYHQVKEVSILSTCNRLELHVVLSNTEHGIREVIQFLAEYSELPVEDLRPHLFILVHQDAIMHLLRVSSGLDSLVLGEGQILAQVKHSLAESQKYKGVGRVLSRLFKDAIKTGKRVRTETSIGTGAVSVSSAAAELAQMKVPDFTTCHITIIGAGKMGRLLVKHLVSKRAVNITLLNRSLQRADDLAAEYSHVDIKTGTMDKMDAAVTKADIVFTCTSSDEPVLHKDNVQPCLAGRPLNLFDISVPRNVHKNVEELNGVKAYTVDDLKEVVAKNQESRRKMAQEAEGILEQELNQFVKWWKSLDTVATISSLRTKVEAIREQELEKALSRLGADFSDKHRNVVEALSRGIVNKILHDPMTQLRAQEDAESRKQAMETLQVLFNLEEKRAAAAARK